MVPEAHFDKRLYTPGALLHDLLDLVAHLPDLLSAYWSRRVSRSFAEKIMLAVTQVNGCRYCSYAHTRLALRSGVHPTEVVALLAADLGAFPAHESVALAFAQHYAQTGGKPQRDAILNLYRFYSPRTGRDIMSYIRIITVGNLAGNSVDDLLDKIMRRFR